MANDAVTRERMRNALMIVQNLESSPDKQIKSRFQSYAQSAPAMLRRNGLGQTAAIWRSRSGNGQDRSAEEHAYHALFSVLERWLCGDHAIAPYRKKNVLLKCIANSTQEKYVEAQNEAEIYLNWIKKFTNALLTTEEQDADAAAR